LHWQEPFPDHLKAKWEQIIARRLAGEPTQYIIGEEKFFGLNLKVNRSVLIPRPETELLVEQILLRTSLWEENKKVTIVDLGTGSGAIAIALAVARPQATVYAFDLSLEALAVAQHNAEKEGVHERVTLRHSDMLSAWLNDQSCQQQVIDILVSNPPYIISSDIDHLQKEVKDYEPRLALDGGADGYEIYRKLVDQFAQLSAVPRLVALEVGQGQTQTVAQLLAPFYPADQIVCVNDLADKDRMVFAFR
jgi:release factor glutamine methyltransferase